MLMGFDHPVGRHLHVGGDPIKLSAHPHAPFAGAPGWGEHTQLVLTRLLKLDEAELLALRESRTAWWPDEGLVYARPSVV
jgi:crotonobetainyl-CoA:carnitine CoA-transferase CaiB-like acyl-CoA transferase